MRAYFEADDASDEFCFPDQVPATQQVLQELYRYMKFKREWQGRPDAPHFDVDKQVLRELTIVADYLDI